MNISFRYRKHDRRYGPDVRSQAISRHLSHSWKSYLPPLLFQARYLSRNYAWVVTVSGGEETDADPDLDDSPSNAESDPEPSGGSNASLDGDSTAAEQRSTPSDDAEDDSSGFLGNLKNVKGQLGDAKEAFSNARGAGNLPTDEEGRVRIVCRRYEERRLAPLDDKGRPTCYEAGNEDCESCVDAVSDESVETW